MFVRKLSFFKHNNGTMCRAYKHAHELLGEKVGCYATRGIIPFVEGTKLVFFFFSFWSRFVESLSKAHCTLIRWAR